MQMNYEIYYKKIIIIENFVYIVHPHFLYFIYSMKAIIAIPEALWESITILSPNVFPLFIS